MAIQPISPTTDQSGNHTTIQPTCKKTIWYGLATSLTSSEKVYSFHIAPSQERKDYEFSNKCKIFSKIQFLCYLLDFKRLINIK